MQGLFWVYKPLTRHSMETHLYYDAFAGVFLTETSSERIHETLLIEEYKIKWMHTL